MGCILRTKGEKPTKKTVIKTAQISTLSSNYIIRSITFVLETGARVSWNKTSNDPVGVLWAGILRSAEVDLLSRNNRTCPLTRLSAVTPYSGAGT